MLKSIEMIPHVKKPRNEIEEFISGNAEMCEVIAEDGATGNRLFQRYYEANKRLGLPVKVMYRQQRVFLAKK